MRYLVTGGKGFIGSHIAHRLVDEGHKVVVLDNNTMGGTGIFKVAKDHNKQYVTKDIMDLETYNDVSLKGHFDAVLHLAAQPSAAISFVDPVADMKINIGGTLTLLKWCIERNIKRFIFTSSMGVYGTHLEAVNEKAHCRPQSFYGVNKLAAEG